MESHIINLRRSENKGRNSEKSSGLLSEKSKAILAIYIDRVVELLIYAIIFFIPFSLFSYSGFINDASEVFMFLFLSGFILFIWIFSGVFLKKKFVIAKSFLTLSLTMFTVVLVLSAVLGVDRASSFFGVYGNPTNSLAMYGSLFVFYFVAASLIAEKGSRSMINNLLKSILVSSLFLSVLVLVFYIDIGFLSFIKGFIFSNNPITDPRSIAVYISVSILLGMYGYKNFISEDVLFKVIGVLVVILGMVGLVFINWFPVWPVLLMLFMIAIVICLVTGRKDSRKPDVFVVAFTVIALVFTLNGLSFSEITSGKIVIKDSSISNYVNEFLSIKRLGGDMAVGGFGDRISNSIIYQTLQNYPALGSGVGTYYYDFSKYKPLESNYESDWNIRYVSADNAVFEKIATTGFIGILFFLLLISVSLSVLWKNIRYASENKFILTAFIGLIAFQFIYTSSIASEFAIVFLLILAFSKNLDGAEEMRFASNGRKREYSGKHYVFCVSEGGQNNALYAFALVFMIIGFLSSYFAIQFFRSESIYAKAVNKSDVTQISPSALEKVVKITPYKGWYDVAISKVYVSRLNVLLSSKAESQEALERVKDESDKALSYSRRAIEISPNNITFWENYSYVYKRMYELGMEGADVWALKGFERAIALDPNNPILKTEMGKIYSLEADKLSADSKISKLSQAEGVFNDALALKADYPDAMTELALVYLKMDRKDEALRKVDEASSQKGISVSTAVQIAKTYYNLNEKERAGEVLNVVIQKSPNISDAHYILGLIYKDQGRYDESLVEFKKVLELNPGNADVSQKIKELEELIAGGE